MLKEFNWKILAAIIFLSSAGLVFVFEATGDTLFLKEQTLYLILGVFVLIFFARYYSYKKFKQCSVLLLCISLVLLILVLVPGIGLKIYGARRWIDLRFITFQPSEFTKLALVIFFAHWFSNAETDRMSAFFLLIGFIFALILLQPDMGTSIIVFCTSLLMFFAARTSAVIKILIALPAIIVILVVLTRISPYRNQRMISFLSGSGYHTTQALISVGSGGIFGVGIGKSTQKFSFLPESNSDSIFAIIAEETGLTGSLLVLMAFFIIFHESYLIAKRTKDLFGRFLAYGLGLLITIQAFLNLSSMLSLTPLTGVPLPFVSSGGSALLIQFCAVGILLNIEKTIK